jgi:hypothetical protein
MTKIQRRSITIGFACCATVVACQSHEARRPAAAPALDLEPPRTAASVSWSKHPLVTACAPPPGQPDVLERGLTIVTSELEYRRKFCRSSSIDWDKHRYVVYQEELAPQRVWLEDVVRDGPDILLVLRRAATNAKRLPTSISPSSSRY